MGWAISFPRAVPLKAILLPRLTAFTLRRPRDRILVTQITHHFRNVLLFFLAHARKDGQADEPFPLDACRRQLAFFPDELFLVVRVQMQGPKVDRKTNAALAQLGREFIAVNGPTTTADAPGRLAGTRRTLGR